MRILSLLLLTVCYILPLQSQTYYVLNIKGDVTTADGKPLKFKDRITDETQLKFGSKDALLTVNAPQKGTFYLGPQADSRQTGNEFLIAVKNAILPPQKIKDTGTRYLSGEKVELSSKEELKAFFRGNILLIDSTDFAVYGPEDLFQPGYAYQLEVVQDTDTSFYLFEVEAGVLRLPAAAFSKELVGQDLKAKIVFPADKITPPKYIKWFTLTFRAQAQIIEELRLLHSGNPLPFDSFFYQEAIPFLTVAHGKPDLETVQKMVKNNLGLQE